MLQCALRKKRLHDYATTMRNFQSQLYDATHSCLLSITEFGIA